MAGYDGPNRVLKWIGQAVVDVCPPVLADPHRKAIGLGAADVDGDGVEELYVLNTDAYAGPKQFADRLFDRDLAGKWADLFDQPKNAGLRNLAAGRSVAALDRRGNGRYGFLVANYGRPFRFYEFGPGDTLVDLAPALGLNMTTGGRGLLVAPLASDRPDVFCVNEHGANFLFRNTGVGTFLEVASELGLADPDEHGRGVAAYDAGDGRGAVVYGNWDGPHRLMTRTTNGRFRNTASPALAFPSPIRTVIAADFDNDGFEELFFHNHGESNRLFRQVDGEWRLSDPGAATEPDGYGTGAAVADIDADGRLELLLAHGEAAGQPLSLFKVPANANNWLRVKPLTRFGAPARGAVVTLRAGGRLQFRVICGGSGYLCVMEPVAHFGLGAVDRVDRIDVRWPDGTTQVVETPAVRQVLEVPFPAD